MALGISAHDDGNMYRPVPNRRGNDSNQEIKLEAVWSEMETVMMGKDTRESLIKSYQCRVGNRNFGNSSVEI